MANINAALRYSLDKLATELNGCSPELRALIQAACAGANGETVVGTSPAQIDMARMKLNEVVTTRTTEARMQRAS